MGSTNDRRAWHILLRRIERKMPLEASRNARRKALQRKITAVEKNAH